MNVAKLDPALNLRLCRDRDSAVEVSVRLYTRLTPDEVTHLQGLGLVNADTQRRVLSGTLSVGAISSLAQFDKVAQLSLAQTLVVSDGSQRSS